MPRKIIFRLLGGKTYHPREKEKKEIDFCPTKEDYLDALQDNDLKNQILQGVPFLKAHFDNSDFTAILRIAGAVDEWGKPLFPNVSKSLQEITGFRGLPLIVKRGNKPVILHKHQVLAIEQIRKCEENSEDFISYGLCGSIIKLEMGLGKTLLAITWSLIAPRPPREELHGEKGFPTLVVVSKTLLGEWKREGFEKFFDERVKVLYYHKMFLPESVYKNISRKDIVKYDFMITTYDVICSSAREGKEYEQTLEIGDDHTLMKGKIVSIHCRTRKQSDNPDIKGPRIIFHTPWERVIADESQRFANYKTFTYKAMMAVYGKYKLCLTGTPIRNTCLDIWTQLRWCGYTGVEKQTDWKKKGLAMMKLHNLDRYILSVDTKDTDIYVPPKNRIEYKQKFDGMEKTAYEYILGVTRAVYDEMMSRMTSFSNVLALFTRLRQVCIAAYLITPDSKRTKNKDCIVKQKFLQKFNTGPLSIWVKDKKGTAGIRSRKMIMIVERLKSIPQGEKVVVFSMFTSCLDLLADAIDEFIPNFDYEHLDGDTPHEDRNLILKSFENNNNAKALLMSYKVGSEGLNLTSANHVICIEPWWTPSVMGQAEARCHRPGQTKTVQIHNIYIEDTIENRILRICEEKNEIATSFLEGTNKKSVGIDKHTLGRILGRYE